MQKHKLEFRRFAAFYKKGQLLLRYIERLEVRYDKNYDKVIDTWFDYCEEKFGKITQPSLEVKDESNSSDD